MKKRGKKKIEKVPALIIILAVFVSVVGSIISKPVERIDSKILTIKIESPLNQTYDRENIILRAVASKDADWMAESIDGSANITECTSCDSYTLYYLKFEKGTHTITVYASDYEDMITQTSVTFTVV